MEKKILFAAFVLLIVGFFASSLSTTGHSTFVQSEYNPLVDDWDSQRGDIFDRGCLKNGEPLIGDVDGDGKKTPTDAQKLANDLKQGISATCTGVNGDVNMDGVIDLRDVDYLMTFFQHRTSVDQCKPGQRDLRTNRVGVFNYDTQRCEWQNFVRQDIAYDEPSVVPGRERYDYGS